MARMQFGGGTGDVYLFEDTDGDLHAGGGFNCLFYDIADGVTPITDLLDADGNAQTYITTADGTGVEAAGQVPVFYGPDDVFEMFMSINEGPLVIITANNIGTVFAPLRDQVDTLLNSGNPNPTGTTLSSLIGIDAVSIDGAPAGSTLVKKANGLYGAGGAPIPLADTIWVAASNAPSQFQSAQYVCDGAADQIEIQNAIDNALGMRVALSPGTFNLTAPVVLNGPDNATQTITRYLVGSGRSATILQVANNVTCGISFAKGVSAHLWDLSIRVGGSTHGVQALKTGTPGADYRSWIYGTIKRVAVVGPNDTTHTGYGLSLKSILHSSIEDVTVTGTKGGIEIISEDGAFTGGYVSLRRCDVSVLGAGAVGFRTNNDAGRLRAITYDNCTATTTPAYNNTVGFQHHSNGGETSGIRHIGCVARGGWQECISTADGVYEVDADFSYAETRPGGSFAWIYGFASRFRCSEVYFTTNITSATVFGDMNTLTAMPNTYELHIVTTAATNNITIGPNTTGVVTKGVAEGPGTVAAGLLRNPSNFIDRTSIAPVKVNTVAQVGTAGTNFTVGSATVRTSLDGKLVTLRLSLVTTVALTASGGNLTPDPVCFVVASAWRPSETVSTIFSANPGTGEAQLDANGNVSLRTSDVSIAQNGTILMSFQFLRD